MVRILGSITVPPNRNKTFFEESLPIKTKRNWLVGQRYFDDVAINKALNSTNLSSDAEYVGIKKPVYNENKIKDRNKNFVVNGNSPIWLQKLIKNIDHLKQDVAHTERDHEVLVEKFFNGLGYNSIVDIKYRRGRLDIFIDTNESKSFTIEVKSSWSLNENSDKAIHQAFRYALQVGTKYIVVTNGDFYIFYDNDRGRTINDKHIIDFKVTSINDSALAFLNGLRKES